MWMDNGQICRDYKQAKDKPYQIKILSQLNACSEAKIRQILKDGNCSIAQKRKRRQPVEWTEERIDYLIKRHKEKIKPFVIAKEMKLDASSIRWKLKHLRETGLIKEG